MLTSFVVVVSVLLAAPAILWMTCSGKDDTDREGRTLHALPDLGSSIRSKQSWVKGTMAFLNDVTTYVDESLPTRGVLVDLHNHVKTDLFRVDPLPSKVIKGKDDWFFLGDSYSHVVQETTGALRFADEDLSHLNSILDNIYSWCDSSGIPFRLAIVRDKNSIYAEQLPFLPARNPTKYGQVLNLKTGPFPVIDLTSDMEAYRKSGVLVYHRLDTHWNQLGAFIGYKTLMKALHGRPHVVDTLELDDFNMDTAFRKGGDLVKLIGANDREDRLELDPRFPERGVQVEPPPGDGAMPWNATRIIRYRTTGNPLKILIFRDSFCIELGRYLKETFGEVVLVRGCRFDKELVIRERPDIVMIELVERNLDDLLTENMEQP